MGVDEIAAPDVGHDVLAVLERERGRAADLGRRAEERERDEEARQRHPAVVDKAGLARKQRVERLAQALHVVQRQLRRVHTHHHSCSSIPCCAAGAGHRAE